MRGGRSRLLPSLCMLGKAAASMQAAGRQTSTCSWQQKACGLTPAVSRRSRLETGGKVAGARGTSCFSPAAFNLPTPRPYDALKSSDGPSGLWIGVLLLRTCFFAFCRPSVADWIPFLTGLSSERRNTSE